MRRTNTREVRCRVADRHTHRQTDPTTVPSLLMRAEGNKVLYCAFHPAFESLLPSVHPLPLLSLPRRLLPVQTNFADHDPQFCSQFREQGPGPGLFIPGTGGVNTTSGEIICPAAKFTAAPATVSSSFFELTHSEIYIV